MINNTTTIPFPNNTVDIKKEIENLSNWIDADIKYQIWSLNAPCTLDIDIHKTSEVKKGNEILLFDVK